MIDPNLNFDEHITGAVNKASRKSSMLLRHISFKNKNILVPLYTALVRPILEYGNAVWCPFLKKHMKSIEDVQRNFTKQINGMRNLKYEDRLSRLKLPSLAYRRLRGDMIEVFKILHNPYDPKTTHSLLTLHPNSKIQELTLSNSQKIMLTLGNI